MTLASRMIFFPLLAGLFSGWSLENSGDTLIAARRKLLSRQRIAFHLKSRDADGASFTEMMRGMHDFFAAIPTDKESLKQSLLAQIKVFTLCVGVVADKDMDDATFGAVMTVAGEGHRLIFCPADQLPLTARQSSTPTGNRISTPGPSPRPRPCLFRPRPRHRAKRARSAATSAWLRRACPSAPPCRPLWTMRPICRVPWRRWRGTRWASCSLRCLRSLFPAGAWRPRARALRICSSGTAPRNFSAPGATASWSRPRMSGVSLTSSGAMNAPGSAWGLGFCGSARLSGAAVCDAGLVAAHSPVTAAIIRVFCGPAACARRRGFWTRRTAPTTMTGPAWTRGSTAGTFRPGLIPAWSWSGTECSTGLSAIWTPTGTTCARTRSASFLSGIRRSSPGPVPPAR